MRIHSLGLFMTSRCNLKCVFCCFDTGPDPTDKLTLTELKDVVRQARELGATWLVIPGYGEPMLDVDLFPLLEYATSLGMRCRIYTNGTLIDAGKAAWLFRREVSVAFKLNSLDEKTEHALLGKKNAHRWVEYRPSGDAGTKAVRIPEGLKHLFDAGYAQAPVSVPYGSLLQIASVAVRPTLEGLPRVARFCRANRLGLRALTIMCTGPAAVNRDLLEISLEEERQIYRKLCGIMGMRFWLQQRVRCSFETNPFIDPRGDIRSCFGMHFEGGNIRDLPLAELHRREQETRRNSGLLSPPFCLTGSGLRQCAARRFHRGCCSPSERTP